MNWNKKDPNNIFNYLDVIFNEWNIEYENEINNGFSRNKIVEIKNSIKLDKVAIEGLNILSIVILSVTIFITIGLGGIFFYKYKKNKPINPNMINIISVKKNDFGKELKIHLRADQKEQLN